MSCQEFHNWARGNRKIFQVLKWHQNCFVVLEIQDNKNETINRVVWEILRPMEICFLTSKVVVAHQNLFRSTQLSLENPGQRCNKASILTNES